MKSSRSQDKSQSPEQQKDKIDLSPEQQKEKIDLSSAEQKEKKASSPANLKGNEVLTQAQKTELLTALKKRFEKNMKRHEAIEWQDVQAKLETNDQKLWTLNEMESTGGEPDVIGYAKATDDYIFYDCSPETPKGRRNVCYDREALDSRKEHKPQNSALDMAADMGIKLLTEAEYRELQKLGNFDTKTSSWIATPADIRKLGGALFADYRYGHVFVYHNGAQSYYSVRGFRGKV